jgi:DNA polymerase III gamma/tau subunit
LKQQADQFSESDLVRFFHSLAETETTLKEAANPRYQVEVALVKLMEMRRLASLNDLVQRIAVLETALRTGKAPADNSGPRPTPASSTPVEPSRSSTPAKSAAGEAAVASEPAVESAAAGDSFCNQVKAKLEQKRRRLMIAALEGAARAELAGDEFVVEFSPEAKHYRDTLSRSDNSKALREACADICGKEIGIRFVIKADDEAAGAEPVAADDPHRKQKAKHAAAADPAVQQVQRTFGAEIIDVKML